MLLQQNQILGNEKLEAVKLSNVLKRQRHRPSNLSSVYMWKALINCKLILVHEFNALIK